jgi:hypothetical protein
VWRISRRYPIFWDEFYVPSTFVFSSKSLSEFKEARNINSENTPGAGSLMSQICDDADDYNSDDDRRRRSLV